MTKVEKKDLLIELHYFPCVIYFTLFKNFNCVVLEAEEHFVKQTYRNRTYILTSNKIDRLSIPIVHEDKRKPIKQLRIDYKQKWQQRHWRAIQTAYAKSPFFEYYAYLFEEVIFSGFDRLWDMSKSILTLCLGILEIDVDIRQTDNYIKPNADNASLYHDMRDKINLNFNNGIIHAKPYNQLFSSTFIKNLSILDLLFNEGPTAKTIIADSYINFGEGN